MAAEADEDRSEAVSSRLDVTALGCHPVAVVVGLLGLAAALFALGRALDPR